MKGFRTGIAFVAPRVYWNIAPCEIPINARKPGQSGQLEPAYPVINDIAIIRVRGFIAKSVPDWIVNATSSIRISQAFDQAAADSKVKGIIMSVDSPGGYASGMYEFAESIAKARAIKPVFAQVDGQAASAAYWAASQASAVYLGPADMVGSIGTYSVVDDDSKFWEDRGIKTYLISSGGIKGQGEMGVPVSEEFLAELQGIVDKLQNFFADGVANGRRMDRKAIDKLADGRIWIGEDAVKIGLADGVQNFKTTFSQLRSALDGPAARDSAASFARVAAAEAEMRLTATMPETE